MPKKPIAPDFPHRVSIEDLGKGRHWRIVSVQPARLDRDASAYPHLRRGRRGIYAWYADTRAQAVLRGAELDVRPDGLVYVGMTVDWLRAKTGDTQMPDNGWSSLELDSRAKRNWDRMADWLNKRRLLYERALRETDR